MAKTIKFKPGQEDIAPEHKTIEVSESKTITTECTLNDKQNFLRNAITRRDMAQAEIDTLTAEIAEIKKALKIV